MIFLNFFITLIVVTMIALSFLLVPGFILLVVTSLTNLLVSWSVFAFVLIVFAIVMAGRAQLGPGPVTRACRAFRFVTHAKTPPV